MLRDYVGPPVCVDEDFEGASSTVAAEWSAGSTTDAVGFSEFLGRLGSGSEVMSQAITVPRSSGPDKMVADQVTIEFSVYQIDQWTAGDKFYVEVNGISIDIGEMETTSTSVPESGTESGIAWERQTIQQGSDLGFGVDLDKKHVVQVEK